MSKQRHVSALAQVVIAAVQHSSDGWFCEACGVECGADAVTLCPCCALALDRLVSDNWEHAIGGTP